MANFSEGIYKLVVDKLSVEIKTILTNPKREAIMKKLAKKDNISISQLWKDMGEKNFVSYKGFYNHIKVLADCGLIKLEKNEKASGQAVKIKYIGLEKSFHKIEKEMKELNKLIKKKKS